MTRTVPAYDLAAPTVSDVIRTYVDTLRVALNDVSKWSFNYAGIVDPGAVGAGRTWLDKSASPWLLKVRNDANDAWLTVGAASGGGSQADAYTAFKPSAFTTSAIETAVNQAESVGAGRVLCPAGAYTDNGTITISGNNIWLEFEPGAYIDMPSRAQDSYVLECKGSTSTSTSVTANINKGARSISVLSSSGFNPGDLIHLSSDEPHSTERSSYQKGEFLRVESTGTGVINLIGAVVDSYDDATYPATVTRIVPRKGVRLTNVEIRGGGEGLNQTGLNFDYVERFIIENLVCDGIDKWAFNMQRCVDGQVDRAWMIRATDSDDNVHGFGFFVQGCENITFSAVHGYQCHHIIDLTSNAGTGPTRQIVVTGGIAWNCYRTPFAQHAGTEYCTWIGCHVYGWNGGFVIRGNGSKVVGCSVTTIQHWSSAGGQNGYPYAVWVGDYLGWNWGIGPGGTDLIIEGCVFDISATQIGHDTGGILVACHLENAKIHNNTFKGYNKYGIRIVGHHIQDSVISHNTFDGEYTSTNENAVEIDLGSSASGVGRITGLDFIWNTFINLKGRALWVDDNGGSTSTSRNLAMRVENNMGRSWSGTNGVGATEGPVFKFFVAATSYYDFLIFRNNMFPSVTLANLSDLGANPSRLGPACVTKPNYTSDFSLPTYTVTNLVTDRAYDADTVTVAELADVVGTLIADLRAQGLVA